MVPDEPEVAGLHALILLGEARRAARFDAQGRPLRLPEQDRARWDMSKIDAARALLKETLQRAPPGPFTLEAAIAAVHCEAPRADATDWPQIALLYELLESSRPGAHVRVNRAFAVARAQGPEAGLALLDEAAAAIEALPQAYGHLVRATLLLELGRPAEAIASYDAALERARNPSEAEEIARSRTQAETMLTTRSGSSSLRK